MKYRSRVLALFLALCLLVSLFPAAFAEAEDDTLEIASGVAADTEDCSSSEPELTEEEPAEEPALPEDEQPGEPAMPEEEQSEADGLSFSGSVPLAYASSGSCGTGVSWRFDDDGLLTISGNGQMEDYTDTDRAAWASYEVLKVVIESGVTKIGNYAFVSSSSKLQSVTISDTVTSIGDSAFDDCSNLNSITFKGGTPALGSMSFVDVTATAYYPFDNDTWTESARSGYPDTISWKAYDSLGEVFAYAGNCSSGLRWALSSAGKLIIAGTDSMDDSPWTAYKASIRSVVIESGVTSIAASAFDSCTNLTSVTVSDSVLTIGNNAFAGCSRLTDISIPDSVTTIGAYAFDSCTSLTSITIPDSVTSVGDYAFRNCSLTEITFKGAAPSIGSYAFLNVTATAYYPVEWASSVLNNYGGTISWVACGSCGVDLTWTLDGDGLLTISGTGEMTDYKLLATPSESAPWDKDKVVNVVINSGAESIGNYAFYSCVNMESITIPATVKKIGDYAFSGCSKLESITIPGSVESIGDAAFAGCKSLTSVAIPDGITSIGASLFTQCTGLASVTIPNSVEIIGMYAFTACTSLTGITIPGSVKNIHSSAFAGCTGLTSITIPGSVEGISENAFNGCTALTDITFSGNAPTIADSAFTGVTANAYYPANDSTWTAAKLVNYGGTISWVACDSCGDGLTWTLSSAGKLTVSGKGAMYDYASGTAPWYSSRSSILEVEIGYEVTSIGAWAFYNCDKLASVTIPTSVKSIGESAFCWCRSLTDVELPSGVTSIENNTFDSCSALASVTLPEDLVSIGDSAFTGCGITSLALPQSVTSIGQSAFSGCTALKTISAAEKSKNYSSVDGVLFNKDKSVLLIYPAGKTASEYIVPASVKTIADNAFTGSQALKGVTINETVKTIGQSAFSETGLTSVTLPKSITSISESTFSGCKALASVSLPETLKSIGKAAFSGSGLTSVELPEGITAISEASFSDCKALASVSLPETVKSIADSSFSGCKALASVTIPASVKSIGSKAFANCDNLTEVVFIGGAPTFADNTFYNTTSKAYYPASVSSWTSSVRKDYGGHITWTEASCAIMLDSSDVPKGTSVWVDGIEYGYSSLTTVSGKLCLSFANANAKVVTTYSFKVGGDAYSTYPTGMKVWLLSHDGKEYTAQRVTEFDNLLGYAGSSIRISGTKGIRMITAIDKTLKATLVDSDVAGYSLKEYGTLLAWASEVSGSSLVLGAGGVKSNYAYLRGTADPIFGYDGNKMQYTNVITGFTDEQCKPDLVMRPYIKLTDSDGNVVTIYGGVVQRSIGYIAYQNHDAFASGTTSYEYVWRIIHTVYGDKYDSEYEG